MALRSVGDCRARMTIYDRVRAIMIDLGQILAASDHPSSAGARVDP